MIHLIPFAAHRGVKDNSVTEVADCLEQMVRLFLPDASVKAFKVMTNVPIPEVCTYHPKALKMQIYKGRLDGKLAALVLEFGKPVHLDHLQMAKIRCIVFPERLEIYPLKNSVKIMMELFQAVDERMKAQGRMAAIERTVLPAAPSPKPVDISIVLDHPCQDCIAVSNLL